MPSQGPLSASTLADDSSAGTTAWLNPTNAATSDNTYATCSPGPSASSHYLKATNFGFTIPGGSTVLGILVEWELSQATSGGSCQDSRASIVKGGAVGAANKGLNTALPLTDTYQGYGGSADLWSETWTDTDVNSSGFGAVLQVFQAGPGFATASADHVRITVTYAASTWDASQFPRTQVSEPVRAVQTVVAY